MICSTCARLSSRRGERSPKLLRLTGGKPWLTLSVTARTRCPAQTRSHAVLRREPKPPLQTTPASGGHPLPRTSGHHPPTLLPERTADPARQQHHRLSRHHSRHVLRPSHERHILASRRTEFERARSFPRTRSSRAVSVRSHRRLEVAATGGAISKTSATHRRQTVADIVSDSPDAVPGADQVSRCPPPRAETTPANDSCFRRPSSSANIRTSSSNAASGANRRPGAPATPSTFSSSLPACPSPKP
jgi:hypothetical protein